jgi:hypothetical protein
VTDKTLPGRPPQWASALFAELQELRAEVATLRGAAKLPERPFGKDRSDKIADLRALADLLEANPDIPLPLYPREQVDLHDAEGVAVVRALAAKFGKPVREDLDDRTQVYLTVGTFTYLVIAWHEDGRPAEADAVGLNYSRTDGLADDPTPVSPARVPLHAGAVTDGGILVDETSAFNSGADCQVASSGGWCVEVDSCTNSCRRPACSPECAARPEEWPCLDSCPAQRAARGES